MNTKKTTNFHYEVEESREGAQGYTLLTLWEPTVAAQCAHVRIEVSSRRHGSPEDRYVYMNEALFIFDGTYTTYSQQGYSREDFVSNGTVDWNTVLNINGTTVEIAQNYNSSGTQEVDFIVFATVEEFS
jgi:hypothetical protein